MRNRFTVRVSVPRTVGRSDLHRLGVGAVPHHHGADHGQDERSFLGQHSDSSGWYFGQLLQGGLSVDAALVPAGHDPQADQSGQKDADGADGSE